MSETPAEVRVALTPTDEKLAKVGALVAYDEDWVGEPGSEGRHPVQNPKVIQRVLLPFTHADWWELTTQDGKDYIGPCCGTAGAMQDILCRVYRCGGWIDSALFLELGAMGVSHVDGFEDWGKKLSEKGLQKALDKWPSLPSWDRIGILYRVLKDRLKPGSIHELWPAKADLTEKDVVRTLNHGFRVLNFQDIVQDERNTSEQHRANRLILLARVLPAMKTFMEALASYGAFEGVAIVGTETPDRVVDNNRGLCIYKTVEGAQEVINIAAHRANRGAVKIRPVRVTVQDGLVFTDTEPK
jgi:hypothetical protein